MNHLRNPSSDEEDVAKKLDLEGEAQSQSAEAKEPKTPEQLLIQPNQPSPPKDVTAPPDQGYDPGPPPRDVDAPERVEEQQSNGDTEEESDKPPPEGDKPEGERGEGFW